MKRYAEFGATKGSFEKLHIDGMTSSGAGLSPDVWDDCPIGTLQSDPRLGLFVMDDFPVIQASGYPYTVYTDTTDTFTSLTGQRGGVGRFALSGTDNDECFAVYNQASGIIQMDATTDPFYDWWFEARLKPSQVAAEHGIFIGFAGATEVAADLMNTNDMVLKVINSLGFQIISAAAGAPCAVIQTIHQKAGGARVAVDATAGTATAAWIKFGMKSVLGRVYFYLNGAKLDTSVLTTATNFPISVSMCPTFGVKIGSGAAENLDIDWWAAAQLR
ncbi:MAG: hypothetical protein V2A65_01765 [Candidatus Omnitrophota bacterium]